MKYKVAFYLIILLFIVGTCGWAFDFPYSTNSPIKQTGLLIKFTLQYTPRKPKKTVECINIEDPTMILFIPQGSSFKTKKNKTDSLWYKIQKAVENNVTIYPVHEGGYSTQIIDGCCNFQNEYHFIQKGVEKQLDYIPSRLEDMFRDSANYYPVISQFISIKKQPKSCINEKIEIFAANITAEVCKCAHIKVLSGVKEKGRDTIYLVKNIESLMPLTLQDSMMIKAIIE